MYNKTLDDFLDAADGADKVLAHARELLRLSRLYQEIAPAYLAGASRLVNYKSETVIIHAANGATATKLRQLASTLADGFSRRGVACGGVEVKVRTAELPTRPQNPSSHKPLSEQTFQTLGHLRDALPDAELRQAVDTLIQRSARQPSR
jgi:hypothetical protein